jgi:hypothetical protein
VNLPELIGCHTSWWTENQGKCQPFPSIFKGGELTVFQGMVLLFQSKKRHSVPGNLSAFTTGP